MDATDKPIGYWLKHLHNLIEAQFDRTLADFEVNRRQWQVLNSLSRGPLSRPAAEAALAPFWRSGPGADRGPAELTAILAGPTGLMTRGWVREASETGVLTLTEHGTASHAAAAERVRNLRGALLNGLSPEQYAQTVRTLAVMAANLEAALGEHPPA
ncbi:MarR family winged helix-turn-helix transcriptional regulator [Micromonospora eburnea]|uniref:DNA-binding transcriptional regulator, MarR family n=2 Tax=Micromonospora eburnea TaxID=227316 RepID=A0A1C6UY63_9ACTN|nr:hypothetical protein [Micromonospora eburnea]SCL58949.1 hypothetical protein GA0070604_3946 [Micromonospora eburnea]